MPEFISLSRTWTLAIIVSLIVGTVASIVGFNLGVSKILNYNIVSTVDNVKMVDLNNNLTNPPTDTPTGQDIPLTNEPITVGELTKIEGEVSNLTATGFKLRVTSSYLNSTTGKMATKTTDYQVAVTPQTKITETTITITIPAGGLDVTSKESSRTLKLSDLKNGQKVTVSTTNKLTDKTLTATTIDIYKTIKK